MSSGSTERVTFEGGYNVSPRPSPDGRSLAYITRTYALIHFLNNNYPEAKRYALKAYQQGIKSSSTPTLPAYIYSVAILYDEVPNLSDANAMFQYALMAEPNNPLTPVMYSSMLDRLSYRLNDGAVGVEMLDRISKFVETLPADARKLAIQQTLLSHNLMQVKLAQQRVLSLTKTQNTTIRENPRTLQVVRSSLQDYARLLKTGSSLVARQDSLMEQLTQEKSWWDTVMDGQNPFKNVKQMLDAQGWPEAVGKFRFALGNYQRSQKGLEDRVASFERELAESGSIFRTPESPQKDSFSLIKWFKGLFK